MFACNELVWHVKRSLNHVAIISTCERIKEMCIGKIGIIRCLMACARCLITIECTVKDEFDLWWLDTT